MSRLLCVLLCLLALPGNAVAETSPADGAALFEAHCASCHDDPRTKAPSRTALRQMPVSRIVVALEFGRMAPMATGLDSAQKLAIGQHLAGANAAARDTWIDQRRCDFAPQLNAGQVDTANWGFGVRNQRAASSAVTISPENVSRLQLKWSLAIPGATDMRSQVAANGSVLFLGTQLGSVLALDQATGCVHWRFAADSGVRSALSLGVSAAASAAASAAVTRVPGDPASSVPTLFFADDLGTVYAVDAVTGEERWRRNIKWFQTSIVSASLTVFDGRVYVPVSSFEVTLPALPEYPCCRSHGGVIALAADSGALLWEYRSTEPARKTFVNRAGVQQWGPSGASVWTTPTVDARRGLLYIGTGQNLSLPATDTSDAVIALDLASGVERWKFQALANDVWNSACLFDGPSCPEKPGPDFDFGGAIALAAAADGSDVILAGQKSGDLYALDPDRDGKLLWRTRLSQGTSNGGIHWGVASDGKAVYVAIADPERNIPDYIPRPGVYAVDLNTGESLWSYPVSRGCAFDPAEAPLVGLAEMRAQGEAAAAKPSWPRCSFYYGHSAAPVVANGVVYAGALDGKLRAFAALDGALLWQEDTRRPWRASNGITGHGGAIDVGGVVPAGKRLFVTSGYSMFGQMPGNVLLAYELPGS